MSDRPICEICGWSSSAGATSCEYCGCSFERLDDRAVDPLILSYGFCPVDTASAGFKEAEALYFSGALSEARAYELGYLQEEVLENGDAYYFPVGWIGCSGHLVTKNPLRLIAFGSYIGPAAHIWAYYQGVSLAHLGEDRRNTLRILSVRDFEKTRGVLKQFINPKWLAQEFAAGPPSLPWELEDVDLYFGIRGLLEAKEKDWFRFEIS